MQQGIHPTYTAMKVTCSCGNVINVGSTIGKDLALDVCGAWHPFYTGKQKEVSSGGRVDRFNKRFGSLSAKK